jgi:hypothetical protein
MEGAMTRKPPETKAGVPGAERAERLKAALRANLARRKAQGRSRAAAAAAASGAGPAHGAGAGASAEGDGGQDRGAGWTRSG